MFRFISCTSTIALPAMLLVTACADDPTQPRTGEGVDVTTPSFAVFSNSWTAKAPYPGTNARLGMTAASVTNSAGQSIVYVFGGYEASDDGSPDAVQASSILAYNVSTNTWSTKNAQFVGSFATATTINGKVYIAGGRNWNTATLYNTLWMYDPVADRIVRKANMPRRISRGVSGVIGGKLYVLMGDCGDCPTTDWRRLDRYDPASNTWVTLPAAPHPHMGGVGGVINGKWYVAGGADAKNVDVFNPATKRWTTVAPLPFSSSNGGGSGAAVLNGKLYVVGVNDPDGRMYAYNPVTNAWNAKARLPVGTPTAAAGVQLNGSRRMLTIGDASNHIAPSYLYTP